MQSYVTSFNDRSGILAEASQKAEIADLNAAISGIDNGRNGRHLQNSHSDISSKNSRDKDAKSRDITLDILLATSPEYYALHSRVMGNLLDTENAVEDLIERASNQLTNENAMLKELTSQAAELEDGTKVARDADGIVRTLDGEIVGDDLTEEIEWTGLEPNYEQIKEQQDHVNDLQIIVQQTEQNQARLGEIREEMMDQEEPPSAKRIESLDEEIKAINDNSFRMEETLNVNAAVDKLLPATVVSASVVVVPDLTN